ncbi:beta family protein [Brevibacillus sp. M2.1A]|uniref:beta family protein n=1 Tax=Brevibacillus TaxID=55080 RepID=UPI00156B20C7|nr:MULTISPECIES: beta family protein [Brevibacillus]MCC8434211.1 beta family protein [Brevibacillus sp. M2.1A]UKK96645.1 hypothetical protein FO446_04030 [Brevibacillus brevis]
MFDKRHYVPILKWKQGEQKAIELLPLTVKQGLTPLLEIPPIDWDFENEAPKKTIDEHLANVSETLSRSWGLDRPLYLDLNFIESNERMASGQHPLGYIFNQLRTDGINAIPVTGTNRDSAYQIEVISVHQRDQLGICIRLTEEDFDDLQVNIDSLLTTLGVDTTEIDLVIDYKYVNPNDRTRTALFISGLINGLPYLNSWRNLILCGTAFPKDLSDVGSNTIDQIERSEWIIWKRLIQTNRVNRTLTFGDYAIANPEPFEADPRLIRMSANIRYTGDDKFIIFKGRDLRKYGHNQYYQLAAQAVAHQEYKGAGFSAGDHYIQEVANQSTTPGNPATWRRAGTNHHLTLVVNELSTVALP